MARIHPNERGFSLVELLVALVFTMVLMAGMANVYKASLSTFYTSGEALASLRRNRMSVDLLADDINAACMYLVDLAIPPTVNTTSPPFYILPNMDIADSTAPDPTKGDELYFYVDQPLSFEGKLPAAGPQQTAGELVLAGTAPTVADNTFVINCQDNPTYANLVQPGQIFIFKDSWETAYITTATTDGSKVTVLTGPAPNAAITGLGPSGLPLNKKHLPDTGIVFITPGQMIKYSIKMLKLDPDPLKPKGIPCLVREQGTYALTGFTVNAAIPMQVITENVSGFKVYLSTNSGTGWAGLGKNYSGFDAGWDAGIRTELDTQLISSGRRDYTSTRTDEHWFRSIPTLVRVDVSTRTATKRAEYSAAGDALAYRNLTQTLVFVPRHSGLTLN